MGPARDHAIFNITIPLKVSFSQKGMSSPREYPTRPILGVGVVVQKDDCILLVQRGQEPGRGMWSLPGGGVELGERLEDAARREVQEECGIDIDLGEVIQAFDLILRDDAGRVQYHYVIVDLSSHYLSGELRSASDVMDARWVAVEELGRFSLAPKTLEIVGKAVAKENR